MAAVAADRASREPPRTANGRSGREQAGFIERLGSSRYESDAVYSRIAQWWLYHGHAFEYPCAFNDNDRLTDPSIPGRLM
jgi:hypothetical protein